MSDPTPQASTENSAPGVRASCAVKLPIFEGPLDLLLHLIRINEVDISDIPIALISEQYLEYLGRMREVDIDVASDYLVMAATLAYIKSRMLLPPEPDAEDDQEGEDPRAELARRLAEYATFKEVARDLGSRPRVGRDVFPGEPDVQEASADEPGLAVSLFSLVEAMRRVLEQLPGDATHHQVARARITVQTRMLQILDRIATEADRIVSFEDLLTEDARTRQWILLTFLAILELAKIQAVRIFQNATEWGRPSGPIRVRLAVDPGLGGAAAA